MGNKLVVGSALVSALAAGAYLIASQQAVAKAEAEIDKQLELVNSGSAFQVERGSVGVDLFTREVSVNNVKVINNEGECKGLETTIERFSTSNPATNLSEPWKSSFSIEGVSVPLVDSPCASTDSLKFSEIVDSKHFSGDFSADMNFDDKGVYSTRIQAEMNSMAQVSFSLDMAGMAPMMKMAQAYQDQDNTDTPPPLDFTAISGVALKHLKFEIIDKGLINKALEKEAERRNISREQLIEDIRQDMQNSRSSALAQTNTKLATFSSQFNKALVAFLSGEDKFGVELSTREPIRLMEGYMSLLFSQTLPQSLSDQIEIKAYN